MTVKVIDSFWNFSIDFYAKDGVSNAFLSLQEKYHADVNLLLFCMWYGLKYGSLPEDIYCAVHEYSSIWRRNVVQPLRGGRTWMKQCRSVYTGIDSAQYDELRQQIKRVELEAERLQQQFMEALTSDISSHDVRVPKREHTLSGPDASMQNVRRYFSDLESETDPGKIEEVENIFRQLVECYS